MSSISKAAVEAAHAGSMAKGGRWRPCDCKSKSKLAIIIPFRDRYDQLHTLLNNLIPFLQYQRRNFRFFIVEQVRLLFSI